MGTQFSMVTHWNTVNIASPMLSNDVMPEIKWWQLILLYLIIWGKYNDAGFAFSKLTCIWSSPFLKTYGDICITQIGAPWCISRVSKEAGGALYTFHHNFIWKLYRRLWLSARNIIQHLRDIFYFLVFLNLESRMQNGFGITYFIRN